MDCIPAIPYINQEIRHQIYLYTQVIENIYLCCFIHYHHHHHPALKNWDTIWETFEQIVSKRVWRHSLKHRVKCAHIENCWRFYGNLKITISCSSITSDTYWFPREVVFYWFEMHWKEYYSKHRHIVKCRWVGEQKSTSYYNPRRLVFKTLNSLYFS
jgi:hypothetical protein